MTVAALAAPGWLLPRVDRAVSDEAVLLRKLFGLVAESRRESVALSRLLSVAGATLEDVYRNASVENWDGYGARAMSPAAYEHAKAFLEALPTTAPIPDVVPEPDGEVAFEWDRGPWCVFSVSVGSDGTLSYAGLYGRRTKAHGTELFVDAVPKAVMDGLARLVALGDGDRRTA